MSLYTDMQHAAPISSESNRRNTPVAELPERDRETLRDEILAVDRVQFADEDIDDDGRGAGPVVSCIECRATARSRFGITPVYLIARLACGECGTTLLEFRI